MILLCEFIRECINQIQLGVEGFNKNNHYKAEMPEKVDFEIYVLYKDGNSYVLSQEDKDYINLTKLNLTIYTLHYPWLKDKDDRT